MRVKVTLRCNECKNYTSLHRVQTAQLQHHEKQEERSRPAGNEQVLPVLQEAHAPQRDQVKADHTEKGRVELWQKKRRRAAEPGSAK